MKAARFHQAGKPLLLEDVPEPTLGSHDVLVRVRSAGMCHTDIHVLDTGMFVQPPVTLGHEIAGEVVRSSGSSWKTGDKVLVQFLSPCGACGACKEGKDNLCSKIFEAPSYGFQRDGGFAEFCLVDSRNLVRIPDQVPFEFASTLGCAGVTSYHAVSAVGNVQEGETVVVYGVGGLGEYAVQFAKMKGARVLALARHEAKLKAATELGADAVIDCSKNNVAAIVREITKGNGADVVLVFVPLTDNEIIKTSFDSAANGGRIVQVGTAGPFNIDPMSLVFRGVSLLGSAVGTREELFELLEMADKKEVKSPVTRRYSLNNINDGFDAFRRGDIVGRAYVSA